MTIGLWSIISGVFILLSVYIIFVSGLGAFAIRNQETPSFHRDPDSVNIQRVRCTQRVLQSQPSMPDALMHSISATWSPKGNAKKKKTCNTAG